MKHHELGRATESLSSDLGGQTNEAERLTALSERLTADLMAAAGGIGSKEGGNSGKDGDACGEREGGAEC